MRPDKLIYFLLALLIASCGKRDDLHELVNYLDGRWRLEQINCYKTETTPTETYNITSTLNAVMDFSGRIITYTVNPDCATSTTAEYTISHSSFTSGRSTFLNVLGGGVCSISSSDIRGSGTSTISLEMTSAYTTELFWTFTKDTGKLTLSMPTSFKGSTNTAFCNSNCKCVGTFSSY